MKAPMPTARTAAVGAVNGKVYAIGGQLASNGYIVLNTVEAYDPTTDTWTTKSSMPTARFAGGVATVNGILYYVGGCTTFDCSGFTGTVEAYDPVADAWITKAPMPTGRRDFGIGVVNGIIYAAGGHQGPGSSGINALEAYDPVADAWSERIPMPTARNSLAAAAANGLLYAIGGASGSPPTFFATVEAYDPSSDTWTTKASNPYANTVAGAATIGSTIYEPCAGPTVGPHDQLLAYDALADSWSFDAPVGTDCFLASVTVTAGQLYAIGGYPAFDANRVFVPSGCQVTLVASFQSTIGDISNCLATGLIDNQGIANALSSKINAASNAAASGDKKTASKILDALINEVNAQSGKHINGIAPQVLLADANSLLSQLQ